ncbi:hypothetical protein GCM10009608_62150 [Pseudonocardia alaniniphila]
MLELDSCDSIVAVDKTADARPTSEGGSRAATAQNANPTTPVIAVADISATAFNSKLGTRHRRRVA